MSSPLTRFMKRLEGLPNSVKNTYEEIADLDNKSVESHKKLIPIFKEIIHSSRKSPLKHKRPKPRQYSQAMKILDDMQQIASKKLNLATDCYEQIDGYIIELDKAYSKFAQNIGTSQGTVDKRHSDKVSSTSRKKKSRIHGTSETDANDNMEFDSPLVEMPVDPDEPKYCICHQVSFGQMICCDSKDCVIEWFHFNCVGLTSAPRGKWYCEACKEKLNKRGRKTAEV